MKSLKIKFKNRLDLSSRARETFSGYPGSILMTALFLLVLISSIWLMRQFFLSGDDAATSKPTTPDVFMLDMKYIGFDATGEWNNKLASPRITHYPEKDTSVLESPQMISRSGPLTWVITSQQGIAQNGLRIIRLNDQVQIERFQTGRGKTLTLLTTTMTAYPQQKWAQTDQPVTIIQPGSTVHADGLTANMNTGDVHLLSKVKGTYDKAHS